MFLEVIKNYFKLEIKYTSLDFLFLRDFFKFSPKNKTLIFMALVH